MPVQKYMLILVGSDGNDLSALAPHLKTLNFEVGWVPRTANAASVIQSTPHVSLVVIDAGKDSVEDKRLLASLRDMHADLPVIWIEHGKEDPRFTDERPDIILHAPVRPEDLSSNAATLLRERFYSEKLVGDFTESVIDVARDTFSTTVTAGTPMLKATNNKQGELSSIVYFAGRGVSGHVVTSASPEYLLRLHERLFAKAAKAPVDKLADLLGELCNRVTGRLKVRHQLAFSVGAPILVHGAHVVMRQISGSPALVVRFSEGSDGFSAELCLQKLDESSITPQANLPSGDLVFL